MKHCSTRKDREEKKKKGRENNKNRVLLEAEARKKKKKKKREEWSPAMSSVYVIEPPTKGKVVVSTSMGPFNIEFWPKEAPKAVRNFVELCLEGYYDHTIFHCVIKSFLVQGGDPTGSGIVNILGPIGNFFWQRAHVLHNKMVKLEIASSLTIRWKLLCWKLRCNGCANY